MVRARVDCVAPKSVGINVDRAHGTLAFRGTVERIDLRETHEPRLDGLGSSEAAAVVTSVFGISPFVLAAALLGALGGISIIAGLVALRRARPLRFALRTLAGLLLLSLGGLAGTIGVGMRGYRALTREDVAARIVVRPVGPQRFVATFLVPGHPETTYELAGDQIYVDAHILKWKPMANVFGLHTAYELDRVAGRYDDIAQERSWNRTVYSLVQDRPVDLFGLRRRYAFLTPLLDAEYGSGTFVPVTRPAEFEVRVSTTGLLIREAKTEAK
jgi:hypothetical protein